MTNQLTRLDRRPFRPSVALEMSRRSGALRQPMGLSLVRGVGVITLLFTFLATTAKGQEPVPTAPSSIDEEPVVVIGVVDEDSPQLLHDVTMPFMLGDDRVVVPVAGDLQIRVFDLDGRLVAEYGRPGAGPGEFNSLDGAWARGDTIEAFDGDLVRVTRFHSGNVVGTVRLQGVGIPLGGRPGRLGEGWAFAGVLEAGNNRRDEIGVFYFDREGTGLRLPPTMEGFRRYQSSVMMGLTPLTPRAQVLARGDTLYMGETLAPEIHLFDASGEHLRRITWEPPAGPDPEFAASRAVELAVERARPEETEFLETHLTDAPEPEGIPVFSSFLVDDAGFFWVRSFEVERDAEPLGGPFSPSAIGEGGRWIVLAPDGTRLGQVDVPDGLELQHIGLEHIVGIRQGELGVEYVQVHRLERRAAER